MWEVVGLSQFQESITLRLVGSSLYAGGFKESKMGEQSPILQLPRLDIPSAGVSSSISYPRQGILQPRFSITTLLMLDSDFHNCRFSSIA